MNKGTVYKIMACIIAVVVVLTIFMCASGCAAPNSNKTHTATKKLQAQLDAIEQANADLQLRIAAVEKANDDARVRALDAQKNLEAAKVFLSVTMSTVEQYASAIAQAIPLLDTAHTDVTAIVGDTATVKTANAAATKDTSAVVVANATAAATIPVINKNADDIQADRDREHNTWGNRIERFIKGILFWVIIPGVVIAVIVGTTLSSGPGGMLVVGKIASGLGHYFLAVFTLGIPHAIHGVIAVITGIHAKYAQSAAVKAAAANPAK